MLLSEKVHFATPPKYNPTPPKYNPTPPNTQMKMA